MIDNMKELKETVEPYETCNMDDDNLENHCEKCSYFCFPIGCMRGEGDLYTKKRMGNKEVKKEEE